MGHDIVHFPPKQATISPLPAAEKIRRLIAPSWLQRIGALTAVAISARRAKHFGYS
jgi:hypothetical protein